VTNVFLSHKKDFAAQAQVLALTLRKIAPGADIFRSEDIEKGRDWRDAVNRALGEAKCFILLYADPMLDWSWCFYEAGAFVSNGRKPRPVFCLHPKTVDPPSPLANLQATQAEQADIEKWIRNDFCDALKCRPKQTEDKLKAIAKDIAKLVNATAPLQEAILKPYIWIEPKWSSDWTATGEIPEIDFADASVLIDRDSSRELGFSDLPNLTLLPFLRRIACDSIEEPGKIEFWIKKFFESLQRAAEGSLNFQEASSPLNAEVLMSEPDR
jgi:TIR domain